MLPFHLRLGPFAIGPMELFTFLGAALATVLARKRMAPLGVTWGGLFDLSLAALVGGAIGSRLFYFIPLWVRGLEKGSHLISNWSDGSGYYGGLVGGVLGVAILARIRKHDPWRVVDAGIVGVPAGFAVGKLGCFFAGCCYGLRCDGFPGVRFAPGSLAHTTQRAAGQLPSGAREALPVHPTQLYELSLGLLLFAALCWVHRRSTRPGETLAAYVGGYSVWRFLIEFLRDDPGRHGFGAGLSDSQITALVFIGISGAAWGWIRRRAPAVSG